MTDSRRALPAAALGFALLEQRTRELDVLHAWLDSWSGLGAIVVGMRRHGYELRLDSDENGWKASFLHRSHIYRPWVGQVLRSYPTPRRAVQEAAWRALHAPWTAPSVPRITGSSWRVTYGTFRMDRLTVGDHTVDLTIDGQPGGTYKFLVR